MPRTNAAEWAIVHQKRESGIRNDDYDGVFLGNDGARWMVGRMFTGRGVDDDFDADGRWWYSRYFDDPARPGTRNMREAFASYREIARAAGVWDYVFEEQAADAVDRLLARHVPLEGVQDLAAGFYATATQMPYGTSYLLPAADAKFELLRYLRYTMGTARLDLAPPAMTLDQAYDLVINANGPVRFHLGYATYWPSDVGPRREPSRYGGRRDVP